MKSKMIKSAVFTVLALATAVNAMAQRNCGTMLNLERLKSQSTKFEQKRMEYEENILKYISNSQNQKASQVVITLPVVVHVVYNTAAQNISVAQIQSQIDVANEDFGRTNADAVNTPTVWSSVSANTNIQFCLAQRDPNGNPTNGIERRSTTVTSFTTDDKVKTFSTGGLNAWDPTRYMNIWVCNMGGGLLGYGEFPTGSVSNTFGVVIQYNAFGRVGNVAAPYNLGRTLTHEFSHCFNLFHIWGDDGTACIGDDFCGDTPNQAGATSGCFAFPKTDACTAIAPGIMFMNYMDYSNDNCLNMFTQNQSTRMNAVLNVTPYNALITSNGCAAVILYPDDAGITSVLQPNGNACSTTFTPQVVLKNFGSNALASATINYHIDSNPTQTFTYTGSLASLATTTVTLPSMATTGGGHTFKAYTTLPNGMADPNNLNDTSKTMFNVITLGQSLPFVEGFEGATFVPMNWTLNNPDAAVTWVRTTSAKKSGTASAMMDNFTTQYNGQKDEIVTPAINLTTALSPILTFQLAYRLYTDPSLSPNYSDTLEVLISTDCGVTYTSIYKKFGTALTTTTPTWANSAFTPTAAQWRFEAVSLNSFATTQNALIKFRNISNYENFLFLDDINISASTGIEEATANNGITIYPNPNNGNFNIDIKNGDTSTSLSNHTSTGSVTTEKISINVFNSLGQSVYQVNNKTINGVYNIELLNQSSGVYFVQIIKGDKVYQKRITISK